MEWHANALSMFRVHISLQSRSIPDLHRWHTRTRKAVSSRVSFKAEEPPGRLKDRGLDSPTGGQDVPIYQKYHMMTQVYRIPI